MSKINLTYSAQNKLKLRFNGWVDEKYDRFLLVQESVFEAD